MKKFKVLMCLLICVTCTLGMSPVVRASSYSTGKAVIPLFIQDGTHSGMFTVSNITDNPISVTVTLYNSDGSILVDDNSANTGRITGTNELINFTDQNTDSTLTFTLSAHSTGIFYTYHNTPTTKYGYGIIKWQQDGNALQGLVAQGSYVYTSSGEISHFSIPINGGLPF